MTSRLATFIACCWLCGAGAGCASDASLPASGPDIRPVTGPAAAPGTRSATPTADAAALLAEIEQQIGDAACDSDAQCHTLAVGAKACGGPEAYRVWSDKVSRAAALADLAARHRMAREAENLRLRLKSDCALTPEPGTACRPRAGDGRRVCQPVAGTRGDLR